MEEPAEIRTTEGAKAVFETVFTSLESHRPAKSERDILDSIQSHFGLPAGAEEWPEILVRRGVAVETFLDFVLDLLSSFVEMVLELYDFFSKTVSTSGGRTTHFEIGSAGSSQLLKFPNVKFPRKEKWVQVWAELRREEVSIDWERAGRLLVIDNGVFYGRVRDSRLLQSILIARRDGRISPAMREMGNRICKVLRRMLAAWFEQVRAARVERGLPDAPRWLRHVFLPSVHNELVREGRIIASEDFHSTVGVDIKVALGAGFQTYSSDEVFVDPALAEDAALANSPQGDLSWRVDAVVFFVALWGLEETSFSKVASLLKAHETRDDLLRDSALDYSGQELGQELVESLEAAIVPTGRVTTSVERVKNKQEILLLPYWKDRWFLYEVWTLCRPLQETLMLGGRIELLGTREIANADVSGITWNLPTQKARQPVARLLGADPSQQLLVWFQRETRSRSAHRNIEPDVRITEGSTPYDDILILECKDRIKFRRRSAEKVGQIYLDGSNAQTVWVVDYESSSNKEEPAAALDERKGRFLGIAYSFHPGSIDAIVRASIRETLEAKLGLPRPKSVAAGYDLIIDVSGSMAGKALPDLPQGAEHAFRWSDAILPFPLDQLVANSSLNSWISGIENGSVLAEFAATLKKGRLIIVTDHDGKAEIGRYLRPSTGGMSGSGMELAGHPVEFIII